MPVYGLHPSDVGVVAMANKNDIIDLDSMGLDKNKSDYGYSLYVLALILMLVVALVAQTIGSFPINARTDSSTHTYKALQNSPEVGN